MGVPEAVIREVPPGAGFTQTNPGNVPVFVGCSSSGPLATSSNCNAQPFGAQQYKAFCDTYGAGPLSRKGSYVHAKDGVQGLGIRLPPTPRTASTSAMVNTLDGSSTITPVVSGTALDGFDAQILFPLGGMTGTGPITYKYSLDGGATWSAPISLGTAVSITTGSAFTTATGLTVSLGSAKIVTTNDLLTFWTRAASASILPQVVTANGASTAVYALSGTPADAYLVVIEWLTGTSSIGNVTGASFRCSLDGGQTWMATRQLALLTSFTLADDVVGNLTGITVTLTATQVITAGDKVAFGTTAPEFSFADLQTALTNLRATGFLWSFVAPLGPMGASDAGSLDSLLAGWATGTRRAWAVTETRVRGAYESIPVYRSRLLTEYANWSSTRVFPSAERSYTTHPVTGRKHLLSAGLQYLARLAFYSKSTDPGQVSLGALTSDVSLFDPDTGVPVAYDARTDPSLFDKGFLVLRTFEGLPGVYPAGGVLIPPAGEINLVAYRRVLDAVEDAVQAQMILELLSKFRVWPSTPPPKAPFAAGDVYEADARAIERRLTFAAEGSVIPQGDASAVSVTLLRTPVPIFGGRKKLVCRVKVTALDYIYGFEADVGIVDPALDAILQKAA